MSLRHLVSLVCFSNCFFQRSLTFVALVVCFHATAAAAQGLPAAALDRVEHRGQAQAPPAPTAKATSNQRTVSFGEVRYRVPQGLRLVGPTEDLAKKSPQRHFLVDRPVGESPTTMFVLMSSISQPHRPWNANRCKAFLAMSRSLLEDGPLQSVYLPVDDGSTCFSTVGSRAVVVLQKGPLRLELIALGGDPADVATWMDDLRLSLAPASERKAHPTVAKERSGSPAVVKTAADDGARGRPIR